MQPGGGGSGAGQRESGRPESSLPAPEAFAALLAAVSRGEPAGWLRALIESLPPQARRTDAWPRPVLSQLLHACLITREPRSMAALLRGLGLPSTLGLYDSPLSAASARSQQASEHAPPPLPMPPRQQHLLTAALQQGDARMVAVILWHCGGDPDMAIAELPSGMLAFACYLGNPALVAALLRWGADHERALNLLSPPAPFSFRWEATCLALLRSAERTYLVFKLRMLRAYERRQRSGRAGEASGRSGSSSTTSEEKEEAGQITSALLDGLLAAGHGGRPLPTVELRTLEARMERQLRIEEGGRAQPASAAAAASSLWGGAAPGLAAPPPRVDELLVLETLEYVVDSMPWLALGRLLDMGL